jgi:hypothetical protein
MLCSQRSGDSPLLMVCGAVAAAFVSDYYARRGPWQ